MSEPYENEPRHRTSVSFTDDELEHIQALKEYYLSNGLSLKRTSDLIGYLVEADYERRIESRKTKT